MIYGSSVRFFVLCIQFTLHTQRHDTDKRRGVQPSALPSRQTRSRRLARGTGRAKPDSATALRAKQAERAIERGEKATRRRIDPSTYPAAIHGATPVEVDGGECSPRAAGGAATAFEELSSKVRRELAFISSVQNVVGECTPRKVRVVLPWAASDGDDHFHPHPEAPPPSYRSDAEDENTGAGGGLGRDASGDDPLLFAPRGTPRMHRPLVGEQTLAEMVRERHRVLDRVHHAAEHGGPDAERLGGLLVLSSREAALNPTTGVRTLNFGGRVTMGSVKNHQLELGAPQGTPGPIVGSDGQRPLVFQFGKRAKDVFILDFRHPLSPVQAFGIGITALARKLATEGG